MKWRGLLITCGFVAVGMLPKSVQAANIQIDRATFPDNNLRSYIKENYDKNEDGALSDDEVAQAGKLTIIGEKEVALSEKSDKRKNMDLTGISVLTHLTELAASGNALKSMDIRRQTALTIFDVSNNSLKELVLGNNTQLTQLDCGDNALTSVDLSRCTGLAVGNLRNFTYTGNLLVHIVVSEEEGSEETENQKLAESLGIVWSVA